MNNLFWIPRPIETRYYYCLNDLIEERIQGPDAAKKNNLTFPGIVLQAIGHNDDLETPELKTLFQDYLWPMFYDEFIFYTDHESGYPIQEQEGKKVFSQICVWMRQSALAYTKEIKTYQAIEDKLLENLHSSSTTKFNDTPQVGAGVGTDDYITNLTTTASETDAGTPVERLKEVRDNIRNVYENWSKEFRKFVLFI